MSNWRDQILREFTPKVSRLTLVADPDGLLLEEGVLEGIRERGFELIPFEDHVAFRYAYESKFRSRWDRGEQTDLVVVLRSGEGDLGSLPYDLLQAGRRLHFNLGEIFPNLSYPVVTALDRGDLDALYEAQKRHAPGVLGDNATKEFVLRHVFEIAPELIRKPSDLLRVLLRRHYRGQRIPAILDERFVQVLRQNDGFEDWPLDIIIPDREAFFAFLQERWPVFLARSARQKDAGVCESTEAYGLEYSGPPDLPFDHDDIRVYIDNLFLEGLLQAVPHEQAESLSKTWLAIGIRTDDQVDRTRRVDGLLDTIASAIPTEDTRHDDWFHFAKTWAELVALTLESDVMLPEPARQKLGTLQTQVDTALVAWLKKRYAGLINLPPVPPVMLHHIPRFLARYLGDAKEHKAAFVLVDGLSLDQWIVLRKALVEQRPSYRLRENAVFAWLPTITSVSRHTPSSLCRQTAYLLPEQHSYNGQGAVSVDAVLGGPGPDTARGRIRQGVGRRHSGQRRGTDHPPKDTGCRPGCRHGGQDHARHGAWHRGDAQPGSTMGRTAVHGKPHRSAAGQRVPRLPDFRPREY
jgi:hypothetical protein